MMWKVNYEEQIVDPGDGGEPISYWWDDMRPKEVLAAIQDAYQRGYDHAARIVEAHLGKEVLKP